MSAVTCRGHREKMLLLLVVLLPVVVAVALLRMMKAREEPRSGQESHLQRHGAVRRAVDEKDRLAVPTQFDIETIDDAVLGLFPLGDQRAAAILANG